MDDLLAPVGGVADDRPHSSRVPSEDGHQVDQALDILRPLRDPVLVFRPI